MAIGNVLLNAQVMNNPLELIIENPQAWMRTSSAKYLTKNSLWQLDGVNYTGDKKELEVDSINYHPLLSRDSAIALSKYQMDYSYYNSGKASFTGIDMVKLFRENSLSI